MKNSALVAPTVESFASPVSGASRGAVVRKLTCMDCPAPYGEDGWCDVVIANDAWNRIAPTDGVLCFRCMTKRLESAGLKNIPVIVASGPYRDANEEWRMAGIDHGMKLAAEEIRRRMPWNDLALELISGINAKWEDHLRKAKRGISIKKADAVILCRTVRMMGDTLMDILRFANSTEPPSSPTGLADLCIEDATGKAKNENPEL